MRKIMWQPHATSAQRVAREIRCDPQARFAKHPRCITISAPMARRTRWIALCLHPLLGHAGQPLHIRALRLWLNSGPQPRGLEHKRVLLLRHRADARHFEPSCKPRIEMSHARRQPRCLFTQRSLARRIPRQSSGQSRSKPRVMAACPEDLRD